MIQIITYDVNKYKEYPDKLYKISKLEEIQALDDFEICIIDLNNEYLWRNRGTDTKTINNINDLRTIKSAITNSKKAIILISFPQNENFRYYYTYVSSGQDYTKSNKLKDIQTNIKEILNNNLIDLAGCIISYEKTVTNIDNQSVNADFNFCSIEKSGFESITFSKNSNKITTIKKDSILITTLDILEKETYLNAFIKEYCTKKHKDEDIPDWINDINFFNDVQLEEEKNSNNEKIQKLKDKNIKIEEQLKKNLEYKSILYANGDELVKVVLEILDEILEYDSSKFVDEKREDFLIKKEDITFVGEIKGLSSAVKNENVSQLDVHVQSYLDDLQQEGTEEKVKGLLIINHQRNKPIEERQEVHEHQIKLATRNESLIIETTTLLKIYEKYKLGDMTKEECKKLFEENIGLLEI